ncbi:unnamed protein product [Tilletia controversa]|nr:unnamed protein product [Tilletia controversa]CAD6957940.1 unnamed protein product [Tilletia controversa]CAD6980345.1 unnamed protein product [Tilletia controversa]CAD6984731.1 unnamed protein product [Tilletia controversa]
MAALLLLFIPLRILSPVVTLAYPLYESYKCITLTPSALRQASAAAAADDDDANRADGGGGAVPAPNWTSRLSAYGYGLASARGGGIEGADGPDQDGAAAAVGGSGSGSGSGSARLRTGRGSNASGLSVGAASQSGLPVTTAGEVAELESWLMYWSILAIIHLVESTVEWVWNWIPLYAHLKILFEFWLVLPQTRGATFLYITYVEPFLDSHENDIDDLIAEGKRRARAAGVAWLSKLWAAIRDTVVPSIATAAASAHRAQNDAAQRGGGAGSREAADEDSDGNGDEDGGAANGPTYQPYWPGLRAVNPNMLFEAAMSALNTHEGNAARDAD